MHPSPTTIGQNDGPGISDENDFQAVSQRETIASDKERIERNRSQYVVIQPGALPTRPGELGPNIVDYALATNHPVGTQLYRRSSFGIGNAAAKQVLTLNSNDLKRYIRLSCTAETGTASSAVTCLGFGLKKYG